MVTQCDLGEQSGLEDALRSEERDALTVKHESAGENISRQLSSKSIGLLPKELECREAHAQIQIERHALGMWELTSAEPGNVRSRSRCATT